MSDKDWTGNNKTTFVQLGANNHSEHDYAEHSFYTTDPHSLEIFLDKLKQDGITLNNRIWEPACGLGHLSEVLKKYGYDVFSSDLIDRGYGDVIDFFETDKTFNINRDILTNPPYKYVKEFVEHSLELQSDGGYVIMFLKIQFLEGQARRKLFDVYPPKYVYVNSTRQTCYMNGDMTKKMSSASCYCWYIWEKGFTGEPTIRWL